MNEWPKLNPHDNHKQFKFDENTNNPVKDGKVHLGRAKPSEPSNPQTPEEHWAKYSYKLLGKVELLNARLKDYKMATTPADQATAKGAYDLVKNDILNYMKKGGDSDNEHVDKGSVEVDAIEVGGFTIGIRLYGVAKGAKISPRNDHSSSSYYSVYSACQGT